MKRLSIGLIILTGLLWGLSGIAQAESSLMTPMTPPKLIDALQLPFVSNGVTTSPDGRIFIIEAHLDGSAGPDVLTWQNGKLIPYPDESWNHKARASKAALHFIRINSLRIGPDGDLWLVDAGSPGINKPKLPHGAKLIQIDIANNRIRRVYDLDKLTNEKSFVDDVRFNGRIAYLTDAGSPALIVFNLDTASGQRVLAGTSSVTANKPLSAEGKILHDDSGHPVYIHADQLEVSPNGQWLYYQPACGPLYRIETKWLAPTVPEATREQHVALFANTPSTGGTAIDDEGNLYVSDTNHQRVLKITADGEISTFIEDPRLLWVDAMWIDSQDYLWMPAAQLNRLAIFNHGVSQVVFPVHVFKVRLITKHPLTNQP